MRSTIRSPDSSARSVGTNRQPRVVHAAYLRQVHPEEVPLRRIIRAFAVDIGTAGDRGDDAAVSLDHSDHVVEPIAHVSVSRLVE